jgi:hydrogenase expression/formation protein HypC
MRVIKIEGKEGKVELGGVEREANFELLEEVDIGDYVLIHAGFAIQKLDKEGAESKINQQDS